MPRTDTPCEIFRPGRNLPHNECECGWMRIEHSAINRIPFTMKPGGRFPSESLVEVPHSQRFGNFVPPAANDPRQEQMDVWVKRLAELNRSRDYLQSLLVQIGEMFGKASHTADDGSYSSDVIVSKVPDLVRELLATKGFASARLPVPQQPPSTVPDAEAKAFTKATRKARQPQTVYPDNEKGDSPEKE